MTALPDGVSRIFLSEAPDHPAPDPAALQQELSGTDGLPAGQNAGGRGPVPGQEPPSRKGRGIRKITALESGKTDIFENLELGHDAFEELFINDRNIELRERLEDEYRSLGRSIAYHTKSIFNI